jgi:hypothetical protein
VLPFRNDFARPFRYASAHLELAVDFTIRADTASFENTRCLSWGFSEATGTVLELKLSEAVYIECPTRL